MKIWLYIMLTVIAILLVVGIALEIFFRHYVANETLRNATRDTTYAADAFSEEYENILKRFVSHTASADSYQLMCDVSVPHTKEYMNLNTSLQSQLSLYTDSSSLIHTAMFSDTKGQLFYSYKSRLRHLFADGHICTVRRPLHLHSSCHTKSFPRPVGHGCHYLPSYRQSE